MRAGPLPSGSRLSAALLRRGSTWGALFLCACFVAGCHSPDDPESHVLAAVVLRGNTPGQIGQVTTEVFRANHYSVAESGLTRLIFEKKGSGMNEFAYGSWLGDERVWVRVRASIIAAGEATFRLECRAWLVRDRGSAAEEEISVGRMHRRPYEKLLNEVADRLAGTPTFPP